jgi:hypothetical protein
LVYKSIMTSSCNVLLALAATLLFGGIRLQDTEIASKRKNCPKEYIPVCSTENLTYKNRCELEKIYKKIFASEGACPIDLAACICPALFAPVCGVDGVTYSNECLATCSRMTVDKKGPCKITKPQINCELVKCSNEYHPVCAKDGLTYKNLCQLICIYKKVPDFEGECPPKKFCICTKEYMPVCGVNGQTYGNKCMAQCASMSVESQGSCQSFPAATIQIEINKPKEPCLCPMVYNPVCGVNGVTYGNSCELGCAGVPLAHTGTCDEPSPVTS